jgi:hypothetical protein
MTTEICSDCNIRLEIGCQSRKLDGAIEVIWCPKCGQQRFGEVLPEMMMKVEEDNGSIVVRWAGNQPSVREISMLRMLDPNLEDKALEEVVGLLRRSKDWRITNLFHHQAREILKQLQAKGIKADWLT